jgi:hypothetical protein
MALLVGAIPLARVSMKAGGALAIVGVVGMGFGKLLVKWKR